MSRWVREGAHVRSGFSYSVSRLGTLYLFFRAGRHAHATTYRIALWRWWGSISRFTCQCLRERHDI